MNKNVVTINTKCDIGESAAKAFGIAIARMEIEDKIFFESFVNKTPKNKREEEELFWYHTTINSYLSK